LVTHVVSELAGNAPVAVDAVTEPLDERLGGRMPRSLASIARLTSAMSDVRASRTMTSSSQHQGGARRRGIFRDAYLISEIREER
jgi:hypothetical protein